VGAQYRKHFLKAATWPSTISAILTDPELSAEKMAEHEQEQEPIIHLKKRLWCTNQKEKTWCCFSFQKLDHQCSWCSLCQIVPICKWQQSFVDEPIH